MTVSSEVSSVSYNGNGSTQIFAVPYYFLADSHLRVILRAADGAETVQTITTNYTVSGAGNQAGSQVTMLTAPATGVTLVILRNVPATQETDYVANDPFPAESHERALDKLTMLAQQGEFDNSRAIRVPDSDPEPNRLPPAPTRANLLMGFDSDGDPIAVAPVSGSASDLAMLLATNNNPLLGAGMIGYRGRTAHERLSDIVSVRDFGAVGDGVADDTAAIQAAINSLTTGTVFIPAGSYKVASTITLKAGVSIVGDGQFSTMITTSTASLTVFSLVFGSSSGANLAVRDLSIFCAAASVQGFKFVHANRVRLDSIIFYGCLVNFEFDRGGLHLIADCVSAGTPTLKSGQAKLWSSDDGAYGCVFSSVSNYRIENNGMGVQSPAVYMRRAVAVKFSNFITNDGDGTGTCVLIENDCQGINFNGGVIVGYALGMVMQKGGGIDKPPISNTINCVDFDQCTINSILMTAGENNQIIGGTITSSFVGTDKVAIALNGAAVVSNTIANMFITGYFAVNGTGVLMNNCTGNKLFGVTIEGCNQGLAFGAGVTGAHVSTCDFSDSVTTPIAGTFAGVGNRIFDCKGFTAIATVGTPAVPASTVAVANNTGVPVRVFINGGTVSLITISGVASGFTTGAMLILNPGETVSITYTVAPTWNWLAY